MYGYRHCRGTGSYNVESVHSPNAYRISFTYCGPIRSSTSVLPYISNYGYFSFVDASEPKAKCDSHFRKSFYRKRCIHACKQCQVFRQIGFPSQSSTVGHGAAIHFRPA